MGARFFSAPQGRGGDAEVEVRDGRRPLRVVGVGGDEPEEAP